MVQLMRVLSRLWPQPLLSIVVALLAVALLPASVWLGVPPAAPGHGPADLALAAGLLAGVILAYRFPIHISRATRISVNTVPLFLITVLLSPLAAALLVGVGVFSGEMLARRRLKTYLCDRVTTTARLMLVAMGCSAVAHRLSASPVAHLVVLMAAAVVMWICDALTLPLAASPITGERPLVTLATYLRYGSSVEAAQYLLAVPGALAMAQQPWAPLLLALPAIAVHWHFKRVKELHRRTRELLERFADIVDERDPYTGGHSRRVAELADAILQAMGVGGPEKTMILTAARLHDIGKINIRPQVLGKPASLTEAERREIQRHPDLGADMLQVYQGFSRGVDMVRHHHEAWDGSGYPSGLHGEAIPFGARVIAVADCFDAMISDRPYRRGMPPELVARRLLVGRGQQWDPTVVDALLRILPELVDRPNGALRRVVGSARPEARVASRG